MKYHFRIHKENPRGYWAECLELKGCETCGDTLEELHSSMEDALNTYLHEAGEDSYLAPLPTEGAHIGENIIAVSVDPQIAFSLLLRHERNKEGLSQQQMAKRLNKKDVWGYQRLERKANPTLSTLVMIKKVLPNFPNHRLFS